MTYKECPEVPSQVRASYVKDVEAIVPGDEEEGLDIMSTLEWLRKERHLNKPHNMDDHLGVLSILLSPDRKSTYLMNHRYAQMWLPPGGHVDIGVECKQCAADELLEELGIHQSVFIFDTPVFVSKTLTQGVNAGHIDRTVWFVLEGDPDDIYILQEKEAEEGRWFQLDEILTSKEFSHLHRGYRKIMNIL